MTRFSEEQLNKLSKEELISLMLHTQDQYSNTLELLAARNANQFGRKCEQLECDGQIAFNEFESLTDLGAPEPEIEEITYKRRKSTGKREEDLSKFPVKVILHELSDDELIAEFGENGWKRLPDQVYKKLEAHPATYEVYEHHIAVYAGKNEDRIVKAPHPAELLSNSVASPSLVAAIMNAKYTNALPLYRLEQEFETHEVRIPRQNMANWVIRCSERYLSLLYDRMHEELLKSHVIQADETPVIVSKDGRPAGSKSYMWVYRTGEFNKETPIVLYDYEKTRSGDHPEDFLKGFTGFLECDGFSGYKKLDKLNESISVACCWAHARRRFSDAIKAFGGKNSAVKQTLAYQALAKIASIYRDEEKYTELPSEERKKRRQASEKRKVEAFFAWLKEHQCNVMPESATGKGISYCLNHEVYLSKYLEDGDVPIDNSASERSIRPFTVGRKNWVLIDTVNGANASAIVYSIVETAKANKLKPYEYLKHLLTEIPQHMNDTNANFLDALLPWSQVLPDECRKKA